MKLLWRIAFRNLFRNGRRNLLTGFSISTGLVGVALLGGYILRMERYLAMQSIYLNFNGHVIAYAKNGLDHHLANPKKYSLPESKLQLLGEMDPRIEKSTPVIKAAGLIHNGCNSFPYSALAIDPEMVIWARSQPELLHYIKELAEVKRGKGFWQVSAENPINISPRLAEILRKKMVLGEGTKVEGIPDCSKKEEKEKNYADPSVQLIGSGFQGGMALADAVIAGQSSTGMAFQDDTALLMPLAMAKTMYGTDAATAYVYFLKKESTIKSFVADWRKKFPDLDIYPFFDEEISAFYVGGMQFNWVMLYLFFALVCTVVGISISNSLYISLMERKAELGTLRSLGFQQKQIGQMLLVEHAYLLLFSFIPGLLATFLLAMLVNASNIRLTIPGLAADIQFRLHLTAGYLLLVMSLIALLVMAITYWGGKKFLRRGILDLLGTSSC